MSPRLRSICIFLISLLWSVMAECQSEQVYQNHGIEFEIPVDWNVANVQQIRDDNTSMNDTKIVLTDNKSAIRIDIIEIPQVSWLTQMYYDAPWYVVGILKSYYALYILECKDRMEGGSGLAIHPDDTDEMAFCIQKNGDLVQWILAWTKPGYGNKFIGIRGYFQDDYKMENVSMPWQEYNMEEPLYDILMSFDVKENEEAKIDLISII